MDWTTNARGIATNGGLVVLTSSVVVHIVVVSAWTDVRYDGVLISPWFHTTPMRVVVVSLPPPACCLSIYLPSALLTDEK
jgi:hypothetical protein